MNNQNLKQAALKQKITHEAREFVWVFLYLALFLSVLSTYRMLLLDEFHVKYFTYGAVLVTAFVVAKVILLGELARLGKRYERKPLMFSAIYKAFVFGLLVAAFHFLEEAIKRLLHEKDLARALHELGSSVRMHELLVHSLVVFCGLIPFFAFREVRRVMGEGKFFGLFFREGVTVESDVSSGTLKA